MYKTLTNEQDVQSILEVLEPYSPHTEKLVAMIAESQCLLSGHFVLLSGQHSNYFLRFRSFASVRKNVDFIASLLADRLREKGVRVDALVTPETAGSILARALADELDLPYGPLIIPTNEEGHPASSLEPGFLRSGERVLVVNDLVTAGKGLRTLVSLTRDAGAEIAGVALFANRHPVGPLVAIDDTTILEEHIINLLVDNFGPEGGPTDKRNCRLCESRTDDIVEGRDLN